MPPFEIIPEVCVAGVCTPGLDFPGFSSPEIDLEGGPLFKQEFFGISFEDTSAFDGNRDPWVLAGFNAPIESAFRLSPNLPPVPSIAGDTPLDEGETGFWQGSAEDPEGNLDLTYRWEFGDGISATGQNVNHAYVDNKVGGYTIQLFVSDHKGATGVTTFQVNVGNVAPFVNAGLNQTVDEGTPVFLGAFSNPRIGTNLVTAGDAETSNIANHWFRPGDLTPVANPDFVRTPYRSASAVQMDSGADGHYLLNSDGLLSFWGDRDLLPGGIPFGPFSQISTTWKYGCGLRPADSTIDCWGGAPNDFPNNPVFPSYPTGAFTQIDTGVDITCGVRPTGLVDCWGFSGFGGHPLTAYSGGGPGAEIVYVKEGGTVPNGTQFTHVEVGRFSACGIKLDSTVLCWGLIHNRNSRSLSN